MNPLKYAQMIKYLTRAKKAEPDLPDVFPASKAPIPAKTQNVQEIEAVNRFIRANPRKDMAGGGMLVQPGFGGTRQGYRSDKAIKAAQQAGNVAKQKARFDKIGKAFIKQDYNALKTLTRPARIAAGAKDAGGILNQADTSLLNNVILGNDVKAQNALAKQLGINRKYMIDTYNESLEFTKAGKSKKSSELRLKRLETQKNLFDEILENPNATVKSMAKKFNKTEKEIVKQSSLLLKNVYDQNVVIGKGELRDRPLKSWLPDDFNTTDNFLDNFSNIKGLRKVQAENIGTLIRDAFGKGQSPKKYTQALAALSEYNKLVNSLPKGLKLNLDHPLSKAFLKGSNVPPDQLLNVTPISSDYNRGFKAKLDTAYKNALLNPNKDKKFIKTIENFADTIGVNIGKGSTKKFDFGTANIAKKTKADFAAELTQNLREQQLARENLLKFQKTKEGRDIIKQIFPKGQKIQIPATNTKGLAAFMKREFPDIPCQLSKGTGCNNAQAYQNAINNLTQKSAQGDKAAKAALTKFGSKVATAGRFIKGALGPLAIASEIAIEGGIALNQTLSEGVPIKQAFADSLTNKYLLGPKLQIDKEAEIAKEMAKGEEFAMAERGRRMMIPQSATADAQRLKKREEEMKALYPDLQYANPDNQKIDQILKEQGVFSPYTLGYGMQQMQPGIGDTKYNEDEAYQEIRNLINKDIDERIQSQQMQNIADAGGIANLAGGGIAKEAGDPSGRPPVRGPNSQGLLSLKNRVRNY
jgi:hypothetical protein